GERLGQTSQSKLGPVGLREDVERIGELAGACAAAGESLAGVLATEPAEGRRIYLCAFADESGGRSWVAVDDDGRSVTSRSAVRDAASIAALCELAEETAGGGDLEELRAQLAG